MPKCQITCKQTHNRDHVKTHMSSRVWKCVCTHGRTHKDTYKDNIQGQHVTTQATAPHHSAPPSPWNGAFSLPTSAVQNRHELSGLAVSGCPRSSRGLWALLRCYSALAVVALPLCVCVCVCARVCTYMRVCTRVRVHTHRHRHITDTSSVEVLLSSCRSCSSTVYVHTHLCVYTHICTQT